MDPRYHNEKEYHNRAFSEGTRACVGKFYAVANGSQYFYNCLLRRTCVGRTVLDYGCGPGDNALALAKLGAHVTGIDISETAVQQATQKAAVRHLNGLTFRVMNAEALEFEDNTFDMICGVAILHHLDLRRAYSELARVLRPGGSAFFLEPLGHNPLINLYRRLTPKLRTVNEHPLLMSDLKMAERYFARVETQFFHLNSLLAVPLRRLPGLYWWLRTLDGFDSLLFRWAPFLRRYAWSVVMALTKPVKHREECQKAQV